jgi:ribosomal protein L7Ae-like RNA K-turn-binding protein
VDIEGESKLKQSNDMTKHIKSIRKMNKAFETPHSSSSKKSVLRESSVRAASSSSSSSSYRDALSIVRRVSSDRKEELLIILRDLMTKGCIIGKHVIVGVNSVSRVIDAAIMRSRSTSPANHMTKDRLSSICIAKDTHPANIHDDIIAAAQLQKIPVVLFPRLCRELGSILKIKRASCIAILNTVVETTSIEGQDKAAEQEEDALQAQLDKLKEFVLSLCPSP